MNPRKENMNPGKDAQAVNAPRKKPYTAPRLTVYGSIEKLTKTGGQTVRDQGAKFQSHV